MSHDTHDTTPPTVVVFSGTVAGNDFNKQIVNLERQLKDLHASARGQLAVIAALVLKYGKADEDGVTVKLSRPEQMMVDLQTHIVFKNQPDTMDAFLVVKTQPPALEPEQVH